ncbi:MAG TPA: GTP 3',8-cyclase MoaA [Ruminiclostridium sp.]|nr:GTP 3',8-cyclase MoaA [Ruminiclostridium sp.]
MKDAFNREISYLRISVTDLCNLRCKYCMPEKGVLKKQHSDILSVEEIETIVRAAAELGINKVRITGGEPLIRNGILEICRKIGRIGGLKEICLTTNGILLGGMADELKDAGITRVNISLDTLRPEKFRQITRGGELADVFRGINASAKAGLTPLKINTVLIGGFNDDEISDFIELSRDKEIDVRFIELMPIGESANWDRKCFIPASKVLEHESRLEPIAVEKRTGVEALYRVPGYKGRIGLINPMSHPFCLECNRIRVTADGRLKTCLHSAEEILLKGLPADDVKKRIASAIMNKPLRHYMSESTNSESIRNMFQIGG